MWTLHCLLSIVTINTIFIWVYLIFRARYILSSTAGNSYSGWLIFATEWLCLGCGSIILLLYACTNPRQPQPKRRAKDADCVPIDVLITCCKEDDDIVINTIRAACSINYPEKLLRVFVLDDGPSAGVRNACHELQQSAHPYLVYAPRAKRNGFKAGNLNHGLTYSRSYGSYTAPLVAGLDADMIVEPDWLRALVPHIMADDRLGLVTPPQNFYNIPVGDPLDQDISVFSRLIEVIGSSVDATACWGTGYLARRAALEDIGGFSLGTLSEDTCTSSMLLGAGWKTDLVDEKLQYGRVPESISGHIKQRTRWNIGNLQNAWKLRMCIYGTVVQHMNFRQRVFGLSVGLGALSNSLLGISFVAMPLILASGYPLVVYTSIDQLRWLLRLASACQISTWAARRCLATLAKDESVYRDILADFWLVPYHSVTALQSFLLPRALGGHNVGFRPSGSFGREPQLGSAHGTYFWPLWDSMWCGPHTWMHLWYCMTCVLAFIYNVMCMSFSTQLATSFSGRLETTPSEGALVYFITRAGWPPMFWFSGLVSCLVPLNFLAATPSLPYGETRVKEDQCHVLRPTRYARSSSRQTHGQFRDQLFTLLTLYSVFCLTLSFWI